MKIFYLLGIIILIIIIFYFLNNCNFIIEKFADSNYTPEKLDFAFDVFDTRIDINNDNDYKSKNIKSASDALNYYESNCNKSNDCVSFLEPEFNPKYHSQNDPAIYLNNKINNKIYSNIYTNDRDQNNSKINYKKNPNSILKNFFGDIPIKFIFEKERVYTNKNGKMEMEIKKTNDVSLPACEKICNDDKDCYGIQTGPVMYTNACVTLKKKILDPSNIIPASYDTLEGLGKVSNIYYKNDYLNSISKKESESNTKSISTEGNNNYTEKKLDYIPNIESFLDLDPESKDFISKKITNKNDYLKYAESMCNKNKDCIGFKCVHDIKTNDFRPPIYFDKKIYDKKYVNIYLNDRNENNSKINYKEIKNMRPDPDRSTRKLTTKDNPNSLFKNNEGKNIVNLDVCKKKCDDDKECYGIGTSHLSSWGIGNVCTFYNKDILNPNNIKPITDYEEYETYGNKNLSVSIYFKEDLPNKISSTKNTGSHPSQSGSSLSNSVSTEGTNNYTIKKLDHMVDEDCVINNNHAGKPLPPNYIDKDKIKNIKTYDDLLNYNKLMCDKNKDCFGFLTAKRDKTELDKFTPEFLQMMAETDGNFIFFNDKINNKISSNIYINDRNENNPNINYKKNSNSMVKDKNNVIDYTYQNGESIYNKDNKKWERKKNDISLDTCKKKCNDNKDCYGIGDYFSQQKACVTYKKDALKSENIISDKEEVDKWCNMINSIMTLYYKDPPNKISSTKNTGFDVTGSHPSQSGSSWSNSVSKKTKNLFHKEDCEVGSFCSTEDGFGIYNNNCDCIVNTEEEEENNLEEKNKEIKKTDDCNLICNAGENKNNLNNLNEKSTVKCYPNNTNFSKICSDQSPTYGVKSINSCNKDTSSVVCDPNYLNGKYIGQPIITPCLNKTDDFDVWCKYYNNKPVPQGYNINSIGVKNLLIGKEGECYLNNNLPDNSKARGICDYNYINNITKISSSNLKNNNFTDCSPINSNFNILCSNLSQKSIASEIMGYDCNPGFARAKCIGENDVFINNNSSNNLSDDILATNVFDEEKIASRNFCRTNCKKN